MKIFTSFQIAKSFLFDFCGTVEHVEHIQQCIYIELYYANIKSKAFHYKEMV